MRKARGRPAVEPERAHEAIGRQRRSPHDLGQPPGPDPPLKLHLPEPVLGVHEAEREGRILEALASKCGIAHRSRTTVTGALSPATRISPFTCGSDCRSHR